METGKFFTSCLVEARFSIMLTSVQYIDARANLAVRSPARR